MALDSNNLPVVSIVALCYNHARYLEETLESILAQTYPNIQLIIMDDCSQDNSVSIIRHWIDKHEVTCTFMAHQKNVGICRTLNEALAQATGRYLQIVACDDILMPRKIEIQVGILEKADREVAVVYSDALLINEKSQHGNGRTIQLNRVFYDMPEKNVYENILSGGSFICAPTTLIRREIIDKIGYYDEELSYEDLDMWLRISKDHSFIYSNYASIKYRRHPGNMSRSLSTEFIHLETQYKIYRKHFTDTNPFRNIVRKRLEECINKMYKIYPLKTREYIKNFNLLTGETRFKKLYLLSLFHKSPKKV